jgi:hypothetical protein
MQHSYTFWINNLTPIKMHNYLSEISQDAINLPIKLLVMGKQLSSKIVLFMLKMSFDLHSAHINHLLVVSGKRRETRSCEAGSGAWQRWAPETYALCRCWLSFAKLPSITLVPRDSIYIYMYIYILGEAQIGRFRWYEMETLSLMISPQ